MMMKLPLVLLISLLVSSTQASEIRVHLQEPSAGSTADIHRVKIYADQYAEIVHHMTVNVENPTEGVHDLVIDGFPNTLIDQSIRIVSTNDIEVLDHKISQFSYPVGKFPFLQNQVSNLRGQLSEITAELESIRFQDQALNTRLSQLQRYVSSRFSSESELTTTIKPLSTSDFLELNNFQETESNKVYSRLLTLSKEKEKKSQEKQRIQEELDRLSNPSQLFANSQWMPEGQRINEKQLQFRFHMRKENMKTPGMSSSSKIVKLEFFFHYLVQPADWEANYLISIQSVKNPSVFEKRQLDTNYIREKSVEKEHQREFQMEITQYAEVSQSTGMDWEDVDLFLTTSRPESIFNLPVPARKAVYFQPQFQPQFQARMFSAGASPKVKTTNRQDITPLIGNPASSAPNTWQEDSRGGFESNSADLSFQSASIASNNLGGVDYSYVYHIQNLVNITSKWNPRRFFTSSLPTSYHHSMLIKSLTIPVDIFTYVAPAMDVTAYRVAFGKFPTDESPLIPAYNLQSSRVEIGDEYTGNTVFQGMQSGQFFLQNVGSDPLMKVSYLTSLPTNSQVEEDKSSWFVKDSVKYKVITEEKTIAVKNSHSTEATSSTSDLMLFIVVDSVPSSTEEKDIKINLISPSTEELVNVPEQLQKKTDEDFLDYILELEYGKKDKNELMKKHQGTAALNAKQVVARTAYMCKSSGNVYWAVWTKSTTSEFSVSLKYKIIRPFDKEVFIY